MSDLCVESKGCNCDSTRDSGHWQIRTLSLQWTYVSQALTAVSALWPAPVGITKNILPSLPPSDHTVLDSTDVWWALARMPNKRLSRPTLLGATGCL